MKKIFAMALCVMVLLSLTAGAAAEAGNAVFDCWAVDNGSVCCFAAPGEGADASVSAAGTPVAVTSVTTVEQTDLPVTYICMIDQSSAYSSNQKNQQQEGVSALRAGLRPQDRLVVVGMNAATSFGSILTDSNQWDAAIGEALVYTSTTTNLYHDLIAMTGRVSDSAEYPGMRCVVIFTDGINDRMLPDTIEQAREALNAFRFSLHTFVTIDPYAGEYGMRNAARMEELSALTPGGICVAPTRDKTTAAESADKIIRQVLSTSVIRVDASQLDRSAQTTALSVSLGGRTGAVTIPTAQLPDLPPVTVPETTIPETTIPWPAAPETTETVEITETAEPTQAQWVVADEPSAEPQPRGSGSALYFLIGGGIAAIVVTALAVMLLSRRRRDEEDTPPAVQAPEAAVPGDPQDSVFSDLDLDSFDLGSLDLKSDFASLNDLDGEDDSFFNTLKEEPNADPTAAPAPAPKAAPNPAPPAASIRDPGCMVRLVPEDHPESTVEFFLETNTGVTVGRNSRANVILNDVDTALSGVHMEFQWDSRTLHMRDRNSTNGTLVNGVFVKPDVWVRLENGMFIEAGSFRYQVYAKKK